MVLRVPIENSGQVGIIAASSVSLFLATALVALRLVAKRMSAGVDYSDYCILFGLLFNTVLHLDCIMMVVYGGFGFHTLEIYTRFGPDTATFFFKGIMAFAMLWNATVCFSKLSVLLMYTALIPVRSMVLWARSIGAFIIVWNIANILASFLICRPLARNWDLTVPGTCGSQPNFYFSMGVINIITDVALIVLPMPYLYQLRMSMRKKLLAMAMLSIGIMTWVITIYRQTTLPGLNFADMTYSGVLATILSGLEPSVAIALACVPLLRPLMGLASKPKASGYDYGSSGNSQLYSSRDKRSASRPFDPLNDDCSEVQLQPLDHGQVERSVLGRSDGENEGAITVEKRWEVRSN